MQPLPAVVLSMASKPARISDRPKRMMPRTTARPDRRSPTVAGPRRPGRSAHSSWSRTAAVNIVLQPQDRSSGQPRQRPRAPPPAADAPRAAAPRPSQLAVAQQAGDRRRQVGDVDRPGVRRGAGSRWPGPPPAAGWPRAACADEHQRRTGSRPRSSVGTRRVGVAGQTGQRREVHLPGQPRPRRRATSRRRRRSGRARRRRASRRCGRWLGSRPSSA